MLTRNRPVVVVGNKYQPSSGGGNKYSPQNNKFRSPSEAPYTPTMSDRPANSSGSTADEDTTSTVMEERQKEQKKELNSVEGKISSTMVGYLHAIAGLTPSSNGVFYDVGYDDGIAVLAEAQVESTDNLDWKPHGTHSVIAAATGAGMVYVARRGRGWEWWMDSSDLGGRQATVERAVVEAEDAVRRTAGSVSVGRMVDEIISCNPDIHPRRAVSIAVKASRLASEAVRP